MHTVRLRALSRQAPYLETDLNMFENRKGLVKWLLILAFSVSFCQLLYLLKMSTLARVNNDFIVYQIGARNQFCNFLWLKREHSFCELTIYILQTKLFTLYFGRDKCFWFPNQNYNWQLILTYRIYSFF